MPSRDRQDGTAGRHLAFCGAGTSQQEKNMAYLTYIFIDYICVIIHKIHVFLHIFWVCYVHVYSYVSVYKHIYISYIATLWLFNIAMENHHF